MEMDPIANNLYFNCYMIWHIKYGLFLYTPTQLTREYI